MDYQAIARKWRPSRFEDLVGQGHVVQTLKNAINQNRVTHAYLFSGARGIGKTSVARIFAKTLRCPNVKEAIPCDTCEECQAITEGRSVDVLEIDGASNNGVEAVRSIRENVAYGASNGKYKIYIIDEVHMLSISAFNALLKTLEEPPPHIIFIFATTELQKIPLTILSRCQRFEFRRLSTEQSIERLKHILSSEEVSIEEEGLRLMATHADGSLRDALSLLDQVLSFYGGLVANHETITETQVIEALGVTNSTSVKQFIGHILKKDTAALVRLIGETYQSGVDLKHFCEKVLEEIRLLYLVLVSKANNHHFSANELDISQAHLSELEQMSEIATLTQIERMAQVFNQTISQLNWSSLPRFVLEMTAIRLCHLAPLQQIEDLLANPNAFKASSSEEESPPNLLMEKKSPEFPRTPQPITPSTPPLSSSPPPSTQLTQQSPSNPQESWKNLVSTLIKKRPLLGALLSHANFKFDTQNNSKKVIVAFTKGSFYESQALSSQKEIDQQIKDYFGPNTGLVLTNEFNETHDSLEKVKEEKINQLKQQAVSHPTVQQVKKALGADIVDVNVQP